MHKLFVVPAAALLLLGATACQPGIPKEALQLSRESLEQREMQTRRFETTDETLLLSASAGVLQDLGYSIDNSDTDAGLIFATKDRDATEAGQVAGAILVAALFGAMPAVDNNQKIRVSLVTRPIEQKAATAVRVTFQRMVWNTHGQLSKIEGLEEPELYQQFFEKLSQSVFLTAHEI
ncbi:hypothetical protein [Aquibaculum arenosum]|uniref:DUF4136 domain-containing protein n=1 Tax=Aquibaculum arenosum TaxID=3032591 RepID=A0ABT5YJ84_9PROT|nr:hypothetical protein [Fodinicurvata sp. CAU 1616]MDF2094949.1 hypothetical protein [Fodinicurvata sp. CAU 1616]